MDLNGLKRCNDCFGYAAGDALICRVADALNDVFPGNCVHGYFLPNTIGLHPTGPEKKEAPLLPPE